MKRISTLTTLIISTLFTISANSQTTYVDHGTSTTYTLYTGDSLSIVSGTYTGTINNWQEGAKISVASGATFNPNNFGYFLGKIYVYGTSTLSSINGQTSSFRLVNYGTLTVTGDTYLGGSAKLENSYGATITFNGGVNSNSSSITNTGTMLVKKDWYSGNGSTFTNNNIVTVQGSLQINGSTSINSGKLYTNAKLSLNGATFTNNCRTIADATIEISNSTVNNNGLFWATSALGNSAITNGGTIISTADGKIKSVNFTNNGTISGSGYLYFTGVTTNNGSGKVGKSGTTSDSLKIYDVTRSSGGIFDNQNGTIYSNTKYAAFPAPDTMNIYPSCGISYMSMLSTLPVKWNFFYVNLSNNTPLITWSSEQDPGTIFEVERSYDGVNFFAVNHQSSVPEQTNYSFDDNTVNTEAILVYYRIKATELDGEQKFTDIKTVRFSNKQGVSIQTAPNPFTSQFSINYESKETGILVIKLYNMNGQLQVAKNVSVAKGFNSITITEAASLTKGIYMVQLSTADKLIAAEKVVKQ